MSRLSTSLEYISLRAPPYGFAVLTRGRGSSFNCSSVRTCWRNPLGVPWLLSSDLAPSPPFLNGLSGFVPASLLPPPSTSDFPGSFCYFERRASALDVFGFNGVSMIQLVVSYVCLAIKSRRCNVVFIFSVALKLPLALAGNIDLASSLCNIEICFNRSYTASIVKLIFCKSVFDAFSSLSLVSSPTLAFSANETLKCSAPKNSEKLFATSSYLSNFA